MSAKKIIITLAVFLGFIFSGPTVQAAQDMLFGGASTTGVYYQVALQISKLMNKHQADNYNFVGRPTGGSVFNINAIKKEAFDFGVCQSDRNWQAHEGKADWDGEPVEDLRSVFSMHPETVLLVTREDTGIKSVKDLKGKK
ncbi:MAG: TAXI family TRAP transporter solute-binding subunit, partial [Desulfosalsimonas sp.]